MMALLNLGDLYVSDFVTSPNDYECRERYPLALECDASNGAARLTHAVDPDVMYGDRYWYNSGTNESMRHSLKDIVDEIESRIEFKSGDIWLDIACNDGTLLAAVNDKFTRVGIDPVGCVGARARGIYVDDYFSAGAYRLATTRQAKVVTTIAMLYDLADPEPFIRDVYEILADDGVWVVQMSYTPLMLQQLAFDNICHEHIYYYGLQSLERLVTPLGFRVVDCSLNPTNGGSFRVTMQKRCAHEDSFGTAPVRDVCQYRLSSMADYEMLLDHRFGGVKRLWANFADRIEALKADTVDFIRSERAKGKTIYGYGASTKGNTLLQYFGLDSDDITAIAERAPAKYGLYTVGSNIPILPEKEVRKANPDYMLVLPWHFIGEFVKREKEYLNGGGRFIVPCPRFEVISNG